MALTWKSFGKIILTLSLVINLIAPQALAGSLFQQRNRCEAIYGLSAKQLILNLNVKNDNFLDLEDFTYENNLDLTLLSEKQEKKLNAALASLDFRAPSTEKQRLSWAKEVIQHLSELTGEYDSLRKRAQTQLLLQGLDEYLLTQSHDRTLGQKLLHSYHRGMELLFDQWITRWMRLPFSLPPAEQKLLEPKLLKKILFGGYYQNEAEVMAALHETDRVNAYNRFARGYRKFILLATLAVTPVLGWLSADRAVEQESEAIVQQISQVTSEAQNFQSLDWQSVQESLLLIHTKDNLQKKLGRPLTASEISDLKKFISQNSSSASGTHP